MSNSKNWDILLIAVMESLGAILLLYSFSSFEENHVSIYEATLIHIGAILGFTIKAKIYIRKEISRIAGTYYLFKIFSVISVVNAYFLQTFMQANFYDKYQILEEISNFKFITSFEFEVCLLYAIFIQHVQCALYSLLF